MLKLALFINAKKSAVETIRVMSPNVRALPAADITQSVVIATNKALTYNARLEMDVSCFARTTHR